MTNLHYTRVQHNVRLARAFKSGKLCAGIVTMIPLLYALLALFPGQLTAGSIKVTWDPARVKKGSVVMLKVFSPEKLMTAEAATGKDRFPLLKTGGDTYAALVGVDMKTKQSSIPVDITLFPAKGGPPYRIRADMKIRSKVTETQKVQKLTLPSSMVDLSKKRVDQVQRDNRTLGDVLSTRSRERYWTNGFLLPVDGRITTRFGTRRVLNGKPGSPHSGVDIAGKKGTPVKCANGGRVLLNADFYLTGNTVVVDHGWGISTIYAHMEKAYVKEGQLLKRGDILGTVGSTGRATGPHLHFGAFIRGAKVDPLILIDVSQSISADRTIP